MPKSDSKKNKNIYKTGEKINYSKKQKEVLTFLIIAILLVGLFSFLFLNINKKSDISKIKKEEEHPINKAICLNSAYAETELEIEEYETLLKINGVMKKQQDFLTRVYDYWGEDYIKKSVSDEVRKVIERQSKAIELFECNEVYRNLSSIRGLYVGQEALDWFVFDIRFKYKINNSLENYINRLENANSYKDKYTCIIYDNIDFLGTYETIDENFIIKNNPNKLLLNFGKNNSGTLKVISLEDEDEVDNYYFVYKKMNDKLRLLIYKIDIVDYKEYKNKFLEIYLDIENDNLIYNKDKKLIFYKK